MSRDACSMEDEINGILRRLEKIGKCDTGKGSSYDETSKGSCSNPSNALVVVPGYGGNDTSGYGGDPRNSYREVRRYLLGKGIDTRMFSFGQIPIPIAISESRKSLPTVATDLGTLDNCFFFDLRKVIEVGDNGEKVNAMVFMVRFFFEGGQASSNFWVQIVLNHHRDAVLELNQIYSRAIPALNSSYWTQPTVGREGSRVTYFEKRYTDVLDFKHEFGKLLVAFKEEGLTGDNLPLHA